LPSSSPESGVPLAGQLVVFTGKLSSLGRKDARALVTRLGGATADDVNAKTTMLVIGAEGFGWTQNAGDDWEVKNGTTPANKWLEDRNLSGNHTITHDLGTTVTGSWTTDFDTTWRWGGSPNGRSELIICSPRSIARAG